MTADIDTTTKIPTAFKTKEINKNWYALSLEIPIRLTPISSGKGEAIIIAPITGSVQLKYLELKIFLK